MAGTIAGGRRAAATNKMRYGLDFYKLIGRAGGKKSRGGGFSSDVVGPDGLTGRERASIAGYKGGKVSQSVSEETRQHLSEVLTARHAANKRP